MKITKTGNYNKNKLVKLFTFTKKPEIEKKTPPKQTNRIFTKTGNYDKNKLVKLQLIQSKIYNKTHYENNIMIQDIEYRLKKSLHIIYKYHVNKKKILFIGTPIPIDQKIKESLKKHLIIPDSMWLNGVITNKISFFKHLSKINKNIDLIVLLNEPSNINALNESYLSRIPVISLNSDLNMQNTQTCYKIPGNFQCSNEKTRKNFFFFILLATLKKTPPKQTNIIFTKKPEIEKKASTIKTKIEENQSLFRWEQQNKKTQNGGHKNRVL